MPARAGNPDAAEPEYRPTKDAFDTAELLDKPLADAVRSRSATGVRSSSRSRTAAACPVPLGLQPPRIYVYTEKGIVTQIEGVGGGL